MGVAVYRRVRVAPSGLFFGCILFGGLRLRLHHAAALRLRTRGWGGLQLFFAGFVVAEDGPQDGMEAEAFEDVADGGGGIR